MFERFPKRTPKAQASGGVRGMSPALGIFFDFNSLKSPFLGLWVIQTGYWLVPFYWDKALQLEKCFFFKNISIMKNLNDCRKTVETGVDPHLNEIVTRPVIVLNVKNLMGSLLGGLEIRWITSRYWMSCVNFHYSVISFSLFLLSFLFLTKHTVNSRFADTSL